MCDLKAAVEFVPVEDGKVARAGLSVVTSTVIGFAARLAKLLAALGLATTTLNT